VRQVALGTAHLFGKVDEFGSRALLQAAWAAGVRRYDTAPSYGGGASEAAVGALPTSGADTTFVTTKVGLWPQPPAAGPKALLKRAAARLPGPVKDRLRSAVHGDVRGSFGLEDVRASVECSLRLLGPVDRLLLHEVHPDDITPELLTLLSGYLSRGDVGALGVATQNSRTAEALVRGSELLTVAHVEAGPLSPPVAWPAHVQVRVGHGVLGPGAAHLRALQVVLAEPGPGAAWREATAGTAWAGADGLALALLARPSDVVVDEVIVATSRLQALLPTLAAAGGPPPPAPVLAALDLLVARAAR
jgi:hypothetical protein